MESHFSETYHRITEDHLPWYAVKLYSTRIYAARDFLQDNGFTVFMPENLINIQDADGHHKEVLRPVVNNLLFIKKDKEDRAIQNSLTKTELKMALVRSYPAATHYAEIPAMEMREFMMMCNPEITYKCFISSEEVKLKPGDPVRVLYGPLKGMRGRLVRKSKKYFLLKEVPGMGVMLKVSRWTCEKLTLSDS